MEERSILEGTLSDDGQLAVQAIRRNHGPKTAKLYVHGMYAATSMAFAVARSKTDDREMMALMIAECLGMIQNACHVLGFGKEEIHLAYQTVKNRFPGEVS